MLGQQNRSVPWFFCSPPSPIRRSLANLRWNHGRSTVLERVRLSSAGSRDIIIPPPQGLERSLDVPRYPQGKPEIDLRRGAGRIDGRRRAVAADGSRIVAEQQERLTEHDKSLHRPATGGVQRQIAQEPLNYASV
jgi:hypothetical protein